MILVISTKAGGRAEKSNNADRFLDFARNDKCASPETTKTSVPRGTKTGLSTEIDEEDGDVGGGDTGDAGGLGDGFGLVAL